MAKKKTDEPKVYKEHPSVDQRITDTLRENYMPYAMSVIVSRAIPEIDGFKPVPPQAAVHYVQDGPAERQPHQIRQHRGSDHEAEPAR